MHARESTHQHDHCYILGGLKEHEEHSFAPCAQPCKAAIVSAFILHEFEVLTDRSWDSRGGSRDLSGQVQQGLANSTEHTMRSDTCPSA